MIFIIQSMLFIFIIASFVFIVFSQLLQVVSITRHGARYPINSYYDGNQLYKLWGQLTPVGMRQHYNLGTYFRKQYIENLKFLSEKYNHTQIQAFSTKYNRTIVSMVSQLQGVYPKGPQVPIILPQFLVPPFIYNDQQINDTAALPNNIQIIPICQNPNILISCDSEIQKNLDIEHATIEQMNTRYKPFISRISNIFNYPVDLFNIVNMSSLFDTVLADKFLNRPLPAQFTGQDLQTMRHLHYFSNLLKMARNYSRAMNTPKFKTIITNFDNKISGQNKNLKWTFISAHDTDLNPLLIDLNISSSTCIQQLYRYNKTNALNCEVGPQFASSIILELHKVQKTNQFNIMVRYNGKYVYLCEKKEITCNYSEFKKRMIDKYIDYAKICNYKPTIQQE